MATLDSLKKALRQTAEDVKLPFLKQSLSDAQYSTGLDILTHGAGWMTYEDFIIPQLSRLLGPLLDARAHVSVLEIGPGPISLLKYLPRHLRQKVTKYKAFEPNHLFAARLEKSLGPNSEEGSTLPCLASPPDIFPHLFDSEDNNAGRVGTSSSSVGSDEKYDVILFCHSMYGLKPKQKFIKRAMEMLAGSPEYLDEPGLILAFHRDNGALHFEDLICHQTASFPQGVVSVADDDNELDSFASFVAGFSLQGGTEVGNMIRGEWRKVCRALGRREEARPGNLLFSSPELMMAFNNISDDFSYLADMVSLTHGHRAFKNREALLHHPVMHVVAQPTEIEHVQGAVQFALECGFGLTIIGGGHSGHCLWPNVVAVLMSDFNFVDIHMGEQSGEDTSPCPLVVAGAGCKTEGIIRKAMEAGLTVPLGVRPSVGAGLWLQGGIGHLARLHGLACDAIVGAVLVSVEDHNQILCIGTVPRQHQTADAIRPENEAELLWAIKGAGTNFGIVISVTFQAYAAPTYRTRNWTVRLKDSADAQQKIRELDRLVATELPRNISGDAYLYWENGWVNLGVTIFESSTEDTVSRLEEISSMLEATWGPGEDLKVMNGVELFDAEMYMSSMHGGHGSGKTSTFKRCVFLKHVGQEEVVGRLVSAIESSPSTLSYLHLLQGGGAVSDVAAEATAFGSRDWDFACVITGVWPRDQDGTEVARDITQGVYDVVEYLSALSECHGAYGADLGPGPRDSVLATKAFGPNRPRLARLKQVMDPRGVLRYACPLPRVPIDQKIIILVTGESCAGKDFCADVWVSVLSRPNISHHENLTVQAVSISNATKREYAEATGADVHRILWDRAYKEQHRPALTAFFKAQERERPNLPEEQFLSVVRGAADVDVLLITGMRDEAPLATFSHLVPECRVIEVYIQACDQKRRIRKEGKGDGGSNMTTMDCTSNQSSVKSLPWRPSLIFENEMGGSEAAEEFAKRRLLPFLHNDLQELASMVRTVPDFPPGIDMRHVLGIPQQPGGLELCVSLIRKHFDNWAMVDSIACCEAGGFVLAPALAHEVKRPLLLIRKAGKLPPPTVSVAKRPSYISSPASGDATEERIELELDKVPQGVSGSVLVVDDVLATGETLCAVLRLLGEAGIDAERINVMVMAEFPLHRGRQLLRSSGFGRTSVQSLLVFRGF